MRSRRTHTKSRLGCGQCKQRRIKCDELRPTCNNCLKHGIQCIYSVSPVKSRLLAQDAAIQANAPSNAPSTSLASTPENYHASQTTSPLAVSGSSGPLVILDPNQDGRLSSDLHLHDLELMHNYCLHSYKTISPADHFSVPFLKEVPKVALSHPFLMHGILAFSALHLAYLNKDSDRVSEYDELATRHQALALSLFRKELNNITPANSGALFAFSTITTILAFGSQQITRVRSLSPIDEMLQVTNLCRGVAEILETSKEWREGSNNWVENMLSSGRAAKILPLPAEIEAKLSVVYKLNADLTRTGFNIEEAVACEEAISELSVSFQQLNSGYNAVTVFRWPIVVKPILFSNVRDRRPMALVALAHYCILLHEMDDRWWLKGWPRLLLQSIHDLLDPSWRDHIQWPREALGLLP